MAGDRDLGVNNLADEIGAFLAALDLHHFCAAIFHEACSIADCVRRIDLIRPIGHVGDQQRILHAAAHGFHVVQHLVDRNRKSVFIAEHGLRERIANQNHVNPRFVDQTRGGVVVGGKGK